MPHGRRPRGIVVNMRGEVFFYFVFCKDNIIFDVPNDM